MAQLTNVKPGDLITAANWNAMVTAVQALTGVVATTGPVTVPNIFGFTLANAVALITLPATQLVVGAVIDTLGNSINTSLASANPLIVLTQMPAAGTGVQVNSPVNLVVTPVSGGGATPVPQVPAISAFKPLQAPIGLPLEIDGQNFDPTPADNMVTFAGVSGAVGGNSNKNQLFVTVPSGIPGAPTTTGQTLSVNVVVTTPAGQSTPSSLTILPPPATPGPTITSIAPAGGGVVGNSITITGTNFDGTTLTNNSVIFLNVTATPSSASATQIVVTIPSGINGLNTQGSSASIGIIVQVNNQPSLASPPYGITRLT